MGHGPTGRRHAQSHTRGRGSPGSARAGSGTLIPEGRGAHKPLTPCPAPRGLGTLRSTSPGGGMGHTAWGCWTPSHHTSGPSGFQVKTLRAPHRGSPDPQWPHGQELPSRNFQFLWRFWHHPVPQPRGRPRTPSTGPGTVGPPAPPTWGSRPPGSPAPVPAPTCEGLRSLGSLLRGSGSQSPGAAGSPGCPHAHTSPTSSTPGQRPTPHPVPHSTHGLSHRAGALQESPLPQWVTIEGITG